MKITQSNKDLLRQMIKTDFKIRYNNSVLGFVWVLLQPFLEFLMLYFIFSFLFARGDEYFHLRLILGLLIFTYFSEATINGLRSLLSKANIILKVNFPRQIVIIASAINSFLAMLLGFIIFFFFWVFKPTSITILWALVPFYLIILTVFIVGFSFFASILCIKFRDLQKIWTILLKLLFYASAIFYPITIIPEKVRYILFLNPITVIIHQVRQIIVDNEIPDFKFFTVLCLISITIFITGYFFFKKNIKKVAEYF